MASFSYSTWKEWLLVQNFDLESEITLRISLIEYPEVMQNVTFTSSEAMLLQRHVNGYIKDFCIGPIDHYVFGVTQEKMDLPGLKPHESNLFMKLVKYMSCEVMYKFFGGKSQFINLAMLVDPCIEDYRIYRVTPDRLDILEYALTEGDTSLMLIPDYIDSFSLDKILIKYNYKTMFHENDHILTKLDRLLVYAIMHDSDWAIGYIMTKSTTISTQYYFYMLCISLQTSVQCWNKRYVNHFCGMLRNLDQNYVDPIATRFAVQSGNVDIMRQLIANDIADPNLGLNDALKLGCNEEIVTMWQQYFDKKMEPTLPNIKKTNSENLLIINSS